MSSSPLAVTSPTDDVDYDPYVVDDAGTTVGAVHWLRKTDDPSVQVGLWQVEPGEFDKGEYVFPSNETIMVLEGEVTIELEDGRSFHMKTGDIGSFEQGTRSTWTITAPFRKFFVENYA